MLDLGPGFPGGEPCSIALIVRQFREVSLANLRGGFAEQFKGGGDYLLDGDGIDALHSGLVTLDVIAPLADRACADRSMGCHPRRPLGNTLGGIWRWLDQHCRRPL